MELIMIEKLKNRFPILIPIISYIVVSWIILQVVAMFISMYNLPQLIFSVLLILLVSFFPFIFVIYAVKTFLFQPLYVDAQIKAAETSTKKIYLSIHSLTPANQKHKKATILNETLKKARQRGVDVKLLAPGGFDRAEGAYIVSEEYKLEIRFAKFLEDQDLRFIIMDNDTVIISYQKIPTPMTKLSRKFAIIKSERLNKLLTNEFNNIWNNEKTLTYEQYIKELMNNLNVTGEESLRRCSDRLGIPEDDLKRFV